VPSERHCYGYGRVVCRSDTRSGANHRFALDDAVLKDNHIAIAGDIRTAIERAPSAIGHMVKIEVEVDRLDQLEIALTVGVDGMLLDNMSVEELAQAVPMSGAARSPRPRA
jgi:nicotinate-nucleotide pyrophosphorylase (carboxylating)